MCYKIVKRGLDIALSATALVVLLPLVAALAVLIRLESPGSPLFVQQRIGRGGKAFSMFKLRSMVKDASQIGSYMTAEGDPRITPFGRFLRRASLDEVPQLWNVFIGDMSLIGPRPETPVQQMHYNPADWQARHRVRPGITGLAQVNGRSHQSAEERLRYDLTYAAGPTLMMDIQIILKTVAQVFSGVGTN